MERFESIIAAGVPVHRAVTQDGHVVECLDATPAGEGAVRRVFVLSTLLGCPVRCAVCDAGGAYLGRLTAAELMAQVNHLRRSAFGEGPVTVPRLDVELTRMGEPSFNPAVLEFLRELPRHFGGVELRVLLSTVGPARSEWFFEALLDVLPKFPREALTLQLSLFTTDEVARRRVVPVKCMSFEALADVGRRFADAGGRVSLHVPVTSELPVDAAALATTFDPQSFSVTLSPLTPTQTSQHSTLSAAPLEPLQRALEQAGFGVTVGRAPVDATACGQFLSRGVGASTPRRTLYR